MVISPDNTYPINTPVPYGNEKSEGSIAKRRPSGHIMRPQLWSTPSGNRKTTQKSLDQCIIENFGSFKNFKNKFTATALAGKGYGWTLLVWSPDFKDLEILQAEKNEELEQWGVIPILTVDVWKHENYLQYQNKRELRIEEWWELVDWKDVANRFKNIVEE